MGDVLSCQANLRWQGQVLACTRQEHGGSFPTYRDHHGRHASGQCIWWQDTPAGPSIVALTDACGCAIEPVEPSPQIVSPDCASPAPTAPKFRVLARKWELFGLRRWSYMR